MGCLGVEMESYALFATAAYLGKKALTLLTVSDSLVTQEETTAKEREQTFTTMMEIALGGLLNVAACCSCMILIIRLLLVIRLSVC